MVSRPLTVQNIWEILKEGEFFEGIYRHFWVKFSNFSLGQYSQYFLFQSPDNGSNQLKIDKTCVKSQKSSFLVVKYSQIIKKRRGAGFAPPPGGETGPQTPSF